MNTVVQSYPQSKGGAVALVAVPMA